MKTILKIRRKRIMAKLHFIAMNGTHGCMPDSTCLTDTRESAIEYLDDLLELTDAQRADLAENYSVYCTPEQGAQYCEIAECDCTAPWEHEEFNSKEDFRADNPDWLDDEDVE